LKQILWKTFPTFGHTLRRDKSKDRTWPNIHQRIEKLEKQAEDEFGENGPAYVESMTREEDLLMDDFLGMCFVACQAYIKRVTNHLAYVHETSRYPLTTTSGKKPHMLRYGHSGSGAPKIEILYAFANYYKHADEWGYNWQNLSKPESKKTAELIRLAGAKPRANNLAIGSNYLGNPSDHTNVSAFATIFSDWRKSLIRAYGREFSTMHRK